jgi:hypothetical protein
MRGPIEQVHWSAAHEILISKIGFKEKFYFTIKSVFIKFMNLSNTIFKD